MLSTVTIAPDTDQAPATVKMLKPLVVFILLFVLTGCGSTGDQSTTKASLKTKERCDVSPGILINGQISFFEYMSLDFDSCPVLANEDWEFKHVEDLRLVLDIIDPLQNGAYPSYVVIEFYAKKTWKGKVVIENLVSAEIAKESHY